MDSACLTCGHDQGQHVAPYAKHWPKHCAVIGCTCPEFERTQGGDAHELSLRDQRERSSGSPTHVTGPAMASIPTGAVAGPPDLTQAIQTLRRLLTIAEVEALSGYPLSGDPVTAAVKTAIEGLEQLQATRDRLADLEVYAAELHELLARTTQFRSISADGKCSFCWMEPDHAHCGWCGLRQAEAANPIHNADCRLAHALRTDPPARGRVILDEVQRLRDECAKLRSALFRADPRHEEAIREALDLPAAQEEGGGE